MASMTVEEFSERMNIAIRTGAIGNAMVAAANRIAVRMDAIAQKRVTGGGSSTRRLNVRSGKLRQSIKWNVKRIKGGVRASIQAGGSAGGAVVKYARIHETGLPDPVLPKNGKYLRFKGRKGWVTVKSVSIPARPYLKPGRDAGARIARQVMTEEFRKSLRTVGIGT
tara:strand:+ start:493 stop:993 length:501 start_codon:yes stop_codon:yes gene_type:complete